MITRRQSLQLLLVSLGTQLESHAAQCQNLRNIRLTPTITNPNNFAVENAKIWLYLPVKSDSSNSLSDYKTNYGSSVFYDDFGHSILELDISNISAYASTLIRIDASICLGINIPKQHHSYKLWLNSDSLVDLNDIDLRKIAASLKTHDHLSTASNIFKWVVENISYSGYTTDDLGSSFTLRYRKGDCTEFSYLTTAFLRVCGIPSRVVGGYVINKDSIIDPRTYHNWSEFFFDGRWLVIDSQKGLWMPSVEDYIAFRYITDKPNIYIWHAHRYHSNKNLTIDNL